MTSPKLRIIKKGTPAFASELSALARRGDTDLEKVEPAVREIVGEVRSEGDAAVRKYVTRFEQRSPGALLLRDYGGKEALLSLAPELRAALELAAERIRKYHEKQKE